MTKKLVLFKLFIVLLYIRKNEFKKRIFACYYNVHIFEGNKVVNAVNKN